MQDLRRRASANFDLYLQEFLTKHTVMLLPAERLHDDEWTQLSNSLHDQGVQLLKTKRNNSDYYSFATYKNTHVTDALHQGTDNVHEKIIAKIRERYPNITYETAKKMITEAYGVEQLIYTLLRHRTNAYADTSNYDDFEAAFAYAMKTAINKYGIMNNPQKHQWNRRWDEKEIADFNNRIDVLWRSEPTIWHSNNHILMQGVQGWTWTRKLCRFDENGELKRWNNPERVTDIKSPNGYHVSLNVHVTQRTLARLDDIMIRDNGKYIFNYKFPKLSSFANDVVSRHDPITIYLSARNPELEREIANAMAPFARSNEGLIGEILGHGVAISPETSNSPNGISVGQAAAMDIANIIEQYSRQ